MIWFVVLSTLVEFFIVVLSNFIAILMIPAKLAIPGFL